MRLQRTSSLSPMLTFISRRSLAEIQERERYVIQQAVMASKEEIKRTIIEHSTDSAKTMMQQQRRGSKSAAPGLQQTAASTATAADATNVLNATNSANSTVCINATLHSAPR
eukprot:88590-Pleurochrysis_carterae.AAC.1